MKTTIFKISSIFLLWGLMGAGCEKEEKLLWEISPDSNSTVIQKEVDGIEFKFCLLNEQGEPATVFNEGENIIFLFSFKNNLPDSIIVTPEFINNDFFRVNKLNKNNLIDIGRPWTGVWCYYSGEPHEFIVHSSKTKSLQCPWVLTDTNAPDYPLCISESMDYLGSGEYFTSFRLNFHYVFDNESIIIEDKEFKINFKIN